jgi:hypothetical protein
MATGLAGGHGVEDRLAAPKELAMKLELREGTT